MSLRSVFGFLLIALVAAGGSFVATYAWQVDQARLVERRAPRSDAVLAEWLNLDAAQAEAVTELEIAYRAERRALEEALTQAREQLAGLFDDQATPDDVILAQVERVITASSALERRTAEFLLAVRPHLNGEQRQRLLQHCAAGVRAGGGYRWRHGQQGGASTQEWRGGPPPGRGPGRGRGGPPHGGAERDY